MEDFTLKKKDIQVNLKMFYNEKIKVFWKINGLMCVKTKLKN